MEWKTIDSAPYGVWLLVCDVHAEAETARLPYCAMRDDDADDGWLMHTFISWENPPFPPTHWMPVPTLPTPPQLSILDRLLHGRFR